MEKTIIVIMGKTAAGKTYLQKQTVKHGIPRLITATTRPKRKGEKDKIDYYFVDSVPKENAIAIRNYHEFQYYLPKEEILNAPELSTVVLDLEGYSQLRYLIQTRAIPDAYQYRILGLYLNPPLSVRLKRLLKRNPELTEHELVERLQDDERQFSVLTTLKNVANDNNILIINSQKELNQIALLR